MGYYTRYELDVAPNGEYLDLISCAVVPDYNVTLGDLMAGRVDEMKWYSHEDEMRTVSSLFPRALFTLRGHGEESGDSWVKYFKDGKMQEERAAFPPFNPEKLK